MAGGAWEDRELYWRSAGLDGGSVVSDGFNDDVTSALSDGLGTARLVFWGNAALL